MAGMKPLQVFINRIKIIKEDHQISLILIIPTTKIHLSQKPIKK